MTASLETLVAAAYMFADQVAIPGRSPVDRLTDAELIALGMAQTAMGVPSDRQFLLPSCRQGAARLVPAPAGAVAVQPSPAATCALDRVRSAADLRARRCGRPAASRTTPSSVSPTTPAVRAAANSPALPPLATAPRNRVRVGACASVLATDAAGVPVGYTLVAANE